MKVALDTNVLAYAEGINGAEKRDQALSLLQRLPDHAVVVPAQGQAASMNSLGLPRRGPLSRSWVSAGVSASRQAGSTPGAPGPNHGEHVIRVTDGGRQEIVASSTRTTVACTY